MKFAPLLVLVAAMLSSGAAVAATDVYKWIDEDGNVHYCDTPPEGVEVERVAIEPRPYEQTPAADSVQLETAGDRYRRLVQERETAAATRAAIDKAAVEREERCSYLRKQLISLQQQLPVYRDAEGQFRTLSRYDAYDGKREYLDDAARGEEIARVTREIASSCDEPGSRKEQAVAAWERMLRKRCEYARKKLALLQDESARTPRQDIEEAQAEVKMYCYTAQGSRFGE